MREYTLLAERDGTRRQIAIGLSKLAAAELAEANDWPESHDAVIVGVDGVFVFFDEWEKIG